MDFVNILIWKSAVDCEKKLNDSDLKIDSVFL